MKIQNWLESPSLTIEQLISLYLGKDPLNPPELNNSENRLYNEIYERLIEEIKTSFKFAIELIKTKRHPKEHYLGVYYFDAYEHAFSWDEDMEKENGAFFFDSFDNIYGFERLKKRVNNGNFNLEEEAERFLLTPSDGIDFINRFFKPSDWNGELEKEISNEIKESTSEKEKPEANKNDLTWSDLFICPPQINSDKFNDVRDGTANFIEKHKRLPTNHNELFDHLKEFYDVRAHKVVFPSGEMDKDLFLRNYNRWTGKTPKRSDKHDQNVDKPDK